MQRLEQVRQALLTGDATDEQQRRLGTVDVVALEDLPTRIIGCGSGEVGHGDTVVYHDDLIRIDIRIRGKNILTHAS